MRDVAPQKIAKRACARQAGLAQQTRHKHAHDTRQELLASLGKRIERGWHPCQRLQQQYHSAMEPRWRAVIRGAPQQRRIAL